MRPPCAEPMGLHLITHEDHQGAKKRPQHPGTALRAADLVGLGCSPGARSFPNSCVGPNGQLGQCKATVNGVDAFTPALRRPHGPSAPGCSRREDAE